MRYILIILVFLSVGANAQMVIKAHANYRPYAAPVSANLLLDDYPNAAAAYSLRKLDKDYTGAAIRVRKDTTGQPEQDIFFVGNELDTAALKSFLNARSGFVVTWYDQSGSSPARNATQSTQTNQPRIALNGVISRRNNLPTLIFTNDFFLTITSHTITHAIILAKVDVVRTINYVYASTTLGLFWNGGFTGVNGLGGFDGTNVRSITGENTNLNLGWFSMRSSALFVARNGGSETNTGSFAASLSLTRIGRRDIDLSTSGEIQEIVSWNSNISANKSGIETNLNTYYGIY